MMRKITKLMLTLAFVVLGVGGASATKLYATYGTPASSGSWDAETSTYAWTASSSNLMTIFEFPNRDLGDYTSLHFTTSGYTDVYRVCFMNGGTAVATIAFYSEGQKNLVLSERDETKNLDLSTITHISFGGASGGGSIKLTSTPYLVKPMTLNWGDDGYAEIDLTDLTASGGFTFNDQTGVLTSTGESGSLKINFPVGGVDLTSLTGFSVTSTGNNLFNNFEIGKGTKTKGFWSNVNGRDDLNQYMTADNVGDPTTVTTWKWNSNSTASTMTISSIKLKANVITATVPGETVLNTLNYQNMSGTSVKPIWSIGTSTSTYYGSITGDAAVSYVNLTDYDELRIYRSDETGFRAFFINSEGDNVNTITESTKVGDDNVSVWNATEKYWSIDLSKVEKYDSKIALQGLKSSVSWVSNTVKNIVAYKVPEGKYNIAFSGKGLLTSSAKAALENAEITSIDATGITAATALPVANPNCLITANAGKVTNDKNVIVDGVCANLVLTDQKPFKAPAAFTAANATFTKTMTDAEYATMMIPFTAAVPEGLVARKIKGNDGDVLITELVNGNVTNDKPVLLKGAAGDYVFTATDAEVAVADGIQDNGLLYGTYDATANVPENSYVLQKQGDEVKFFKAIDGTTVKAFRAYLDLGHSEGAYYARNFTFDFENEATGLQQAAFAPQRQAVIYNLQGQRIAQPAQGLYIKGGKKVIIK